MSDGYPATPKVSPHARERCQQMKISTKVAKAIVRHPSVIRDAVSDQDCLPEHHRVIVSSVLYSAYQVVYVPEQQMIVTIRYVDASLYDTAS